MKLKCEYCEKELSSKKNLKNHIKRFHPEKIKVNYRCEFCKEGFETEQGILSHIKKHKDITKEKEYYNNFIKKKCKYCNEEMKYETKFNKDFCCQSHFLSFKKEQEGKELKHECQICKSKFENLKLLGGHVSKNHKEINSEDYYIKYIQENKDEGNCKWCGKELKFVSFTNGYRNFCYNTDCNVLWHNKYNKRHIKAGKEIRKTANKYPERQSTNINYWINKGYSEEEAVIKLSERQTTFSKEVCIEKYGKEKGLEIWNARQEKWQNTLNSKSQEEILRINKKKSISLYNMIEKYGEQIGREKYKEWVNSSQFISKSSIVFFDSLVKNLKHKNYMYGEKGEHDCETDKFYYDFVDKTNKKVIEYYGDFWHANPNKYKENDVVNFPNHKTKLVKDIWEKDKIKVNMANKNGYKVLVIWENECNKDKEKTIKKCLNFLNE